MRNRRTGLGWNNMVLISLVSGISIILKPYFRLPFAFIQTTFGMPVGAFIGGIYMFWPLVLGSFIRRRGTILMSCVIQGLTAVVAGFTGLLGPAAVLSYITPAPVMEALLWKGWLDGRHNPRSSLIFILAGSLGNLAGAATNACLFFALRGEAAAIAAGASMISGALGGWLGYIVGDRVQRLTEKSKILSV